MTKYKLTYFDFNGGRGEALRIALHAAEIKFEDQRINFEEFNEQRESFRFKAVPILEIDGQQITQTNAMSRYVGKMAGLYPEDHLQALYCDEVMDALEDVTHHIGKTIHLKDEALVLARKNLVDGWLTVFLKGMEQLLVRGGGKYFTDKRLTIADLKMFVQINSLRSGVLDHVPSNLVETIAPELIKHQERIASEPVVVTYYESLKG